MTREAYEYKAMLLISASGKLFRTMWGRGRYVGVGGSRQVGRRQEAHGNGLLACSVRDWGQGEDAEPMMTAGRQLKSNLWPSLIWPSTRLR
jgi:hypothetical protein